MRAPRIATFAAFLPVWLLVQNTSCALSGTVQDAAGAVIPNVKVTLTGEGNAARFSPKLTGVSKRGD